MKKLFCIFALATLAGQVLFAAAYQWTNTLGGSWYNIFNWSPNGLPGTNDTANITNAGNYTVTLTGNVTATPGILTLGGGGNPTLLIGDNATLAPMVVCSVTTGGTLAISNSLASATITGYVDVQSGGQFWIEGTAQKMFYSLNVGNQGTIIWSGGNWSTGGGGGTQFYNSGLFQITGDNTTSYGGGAGSLILNNSGIVRKTGGSGVTAFGLALTNQPAGLVDAQAGTLAFAAGNNTVAGSFTSTAPGKIMLTGGTWTDGGGTFSGTGTNTFSSGTFNLRTNPPAGLQFIGGDVYITGANTFQQAGAITNLAIDGAALHGTNAVAGTFSFTSGSVYDRLTILTNGLWLVSGSANKLLYNLNSLDNQGTVICGGSLSVGGSQYLTNNGLWQFTNDCNVAWGGSAAPLFLNKGIVRKTGGTGTSGFTYCFFINQPGGLVESQIGTLSLANTTNILGGAFTATLPGKINISGITLDAGGTCGGSSTNQFSSGAFYLRTNPIPGLQLTGGFIYVAGTNTFQNAGAITNLTLDGATLAGSNVVGGGTLTVNSGSLTGQLLVQNNGQLWLTTGGSKSIGTAMLINQGTVTFNAPGISVASTTISNGGLWQITGDYGFTYGGGSWPLFTNSGLFKKSSGSGVAANTSMNFYNQTSGVVEVAAGTLQLPAGSTNFAGTLRLSGGTLNANGTLCVAGGTLDGSGTLGANSFTGGSISPGLNGPGLINFSSGLNVNSNVTLVVDGTGPVVGSLYDQLSVTGTVALTNCNLQITGLPNEPAGTTFVLINNDATDAVGGAFAGLPENAPITVGAQTFRIHYAGASGNDVTLVRDGVIVGPLLSLRGITNGSSYFSGAGAIPFTAFTVRASTNLINWTSVGAVTSDVSGAWNFIDTNAWRYAHRFYNTTN